MTVSSNRSLVLASASPYRRELLARLGLAFESWSPDIDEAALPGEAPAATAVRLARAKAKAGESRWPAAWIIGSDQVADVDGRAVSKPGTLDNARRQLRELSGRTVLFHTALCLASAARGRAHQRLVTTEVAFRPLSEAEIERYLAREPALDCAGSAKSEGLGISLLVRLGGDDPTALVGLPLIALGEMLRAEGFQVP
ncbi:MAG TPA: Maf family nucleotide pyrophosphatase [Usitatibacter sp.]|nr:Maf family nucleotide pyrophosphatase [Usitatibacter sp.]